MQALGFCTWVYFCSVSNLLAKNLFRESLSAGPIVPIQPEEGVQQLFHASRLFRSTRLPHALPCPELDIWFLHNLTIHHNLSSRVILDWVSLKSEIAKKISESENLKSFGSVNQTCYTFGEHWISISCEMFISAEHGRAKSLCGKKALVFFLGSFSPPSAVYTSLSLNTQFLWI